MATLTVGANGTYSTIAAAVAATQDGDTVLVQAGTYTNDFFTISHKITLQSVGGTAYDIATVSPPNGKAIATVDNDATINGFGFSGAVVGDGNGAGIRYEAGNLVVNNSVFWNNQDGILGAANPAGTILVENSEFSDNGVGDGYTHNLYIGAIASFTLVNSYMHDANGGHEVKSRAYNNVIEGNRIFDNNGDGSYSIDLPNGGNDTVANNVIEKGANAVNYSTIHFGGEGTPYAGSNLAISGNTIVNDNANGILVNNQAGSDPVTLTNNQTWGYTNANLGTVTASGNTVLTTRPTLNLTSVAPTVPAVSPIDPQPTSAVPAGTSLVDPGPGGAVVASGHVLLVGAGQQFTSLGAALAASQDGDTIDVEAGTYVNDFGTVNHKVVIQGVGGIAHFTETPGLLDYGGILTINNDATLANLSFSGASDYNGHAGGIAINAGNVTVNNCGFDGNNQAIYTADSTTISLSIYNSEISDNGNDNKGTHNLRVGAINSFVLKNSDVNGAFSGHEISTSSYNTLIENNRIWDGPTANASFAIDLSEGGNATIENNVIEKGANAANGVFILDGGEGPTYDNSNVTISGNTFVSDLQNLYHPYTYFIVGASGTSATPTTTVTGNTFVGGVPGSQQVQNVTEGAGNVTAPSATVDMTTPGISAALAPAVPPPSPLPAPDTLTVSLSDTTALVGAEFLVSVDGNVAGGGLVTAGSAQAPLTFAFNGNWGAGSHTVTVTGLNLSGEEGHPTQLQVSGITLDNAAFATSTTLDGFTPSMSAVLGAVTPSPGIRTSGTVATLGSGPDSIVLDVSEDAWQGDAQFTVSVDGHQIGGTETATASHAAGQTQALTLEGSFGTTPHQVAVSFINDAWGGTAQTDRNLYVDSVTDGTATTPGAALHQDGTASFAVSAPPPAITLGSGPDSIVLDVSEDAWQGDAQFTVSVDGHQIGGTETATASHAAGQTQALTLEGSFGATPHQVAVSFINDAWGGTAQTDRNLYVDSVTDGTATAPGATLYQNGTSSFAVGAPAPVTVGSGPDKTVLHLSEDAWQGDAQFTISVDGQKVGGTQTATASHAAGQTQEFDILGAFAAGTHQVAVSFINDAWGGTAQTDRNLHVDTVGPAAVNSTLWANGTQTFTATFATSGS